MLTECFPYLTFLFFVRTDGTGKSKGCQSFLQNIIDHTSCWTPWCKCEATFNFKRKVQINKINKRKDSQAQCSMHLADSIHLIAM